MNVHRISSFSKTTYKLIQKSRSRSRSPVNYNVEPTLRRTNGIPLKLTDRLNYLGEIFKNEKFIKYYNQAPPRNTSSLDQITKYLTKYTGPKGEIELANGVIVAKRHIHVTPEDAKELGVEDKQIVSVKVNTNGRSLVFGDVVVRVSPKFALAMHIDTDESNAGNVAPGTMGEIVK